MKFKLNEILPRLMILLTGHGRHQVKLGVDFEWSPISWTHNIFRAYELLFWRRLGKSNEIGDTIRAESSVSYSHKGGITKYTFHTREAICAHIETQIRKVFDRKFNFGFVKLPQIVTPEGFGFAPLAGMYKLAIAFDAAANGGHGGASWSHTVTGSNPIIFVAESTVNAGTPTCDYNSVACTQIDAQNTGPANYRQTFWGQGNPATGAHNVDCGGIGREGCSSSYSGASSSFPDATNKGGNSSSSLTVATSIVAANCWVVYGVTSERTVNSIQSASTGSTQRSNIGTTSDYTTGIFDSNGTQSGSYSMTVTISGAGGTPGMAGVTASFAPAPTTAIKTFDGLAYASTKTVDGLAIASVKTWNGLQ